MAVKKTMRESAPVQPESLVYVGPNLPRSLVMKYQVFVGGYPPSMESIFTQQPAVKKLFVPVKELTKAVQEISQAGTPLNKYYKLAQEVK